MTRTPTCIWRIRPEVVRALDERLGPPLDSYVNGSHWEQALASTVTVESLWEGLECFPAYGDEMEPATLAVAASARLGERADAAGLVDHQRIGDEWERADRRVSIVAMLLDELAG